MVHSWCESSPCCLACREDVPSPFIELHHSQSLNAFRLQAAPEALPLPAALAPFETGVWVWCPLVANVANLILSHKHWTHGEHEASPLAAVWGAQGVPLRVRLRILVQLAAKVRGWRSEHHGVYQGCLRKTVLQRAAASHIPCCVTTTSVPR